MYSECVVFPYILKQFILCVLLHAVKSNYYRIQVLRVSCIDCTIGSAILHVQQIKHGHHHMRHPTGVELT